MTLKKAHRSVKLGALNVSVIRTGATAHWNTGVEMNLHKPFSKLMVLTLLLPALLTGNPTPMRAASVTSDAPRMAQKTLDCTGANLIHRRCPTRQQST
jgi:hypothetical protein